MTGDPHEVMFIRIECDNHTKPRKVVTFERRSSGVGTWREMSVQHARGRRQQKQARADHVAPEPTGHEILDYLQATRPPGFQQSFRPLTADAGNSIQDDKLAKTYPNECDRCGLNVPRQERKMIPLLDLLANAGRRQVTLQELWTLANEWDKRHTNADGT